MTHLLRSLIRETLLLEEVYGAQAVVYHGTKADPIALIDALLSDKFTPGVGAGAMYGKGLYTVYDIKRTKTEKGDYGDHVIKLKVNLYGYIIFDPEIALKVYKRPLTPAQQAEEVGYSEDVVEALKRVKPPKNSKFTSDSALSVYRSLQYEVKGLVFTGRNDGRVVVVYDPTTAVPMAWKRVARNGDPVSEPWTPVDRAALLAPLDRPDVSARVGRPVRQSALRRSAVGDFEAGKWDPLTSFKRLERLPEDQRVVKGDLDISSTSVTELPAGLRVGGNLNLRYTHITSLPAGLQVGGNLYLTGTPIASLPSDLRVGGSLYLTSTPIASITAGLRVGGSLYLEDTLITSLPSDLRVGGSLYLRQTPITSLPSGLQVSEDLLLFRTHITSLPSDLRVGGNLNLRYTHITSLPAGLQVGGNLYLTGTPIASLPAGLRVGGDLDISDTSVASLPSDLRVGGGLYLAETSITSLPSGLKVSGFLNLTGTSITSLPAGLRVGGDLDLSYTPITSLPSDLEVGDDIYGFDRKYWVDVPEHLKDKLR